MASIDELNAYKQKMAAERANVERFLKQAAQSTGNRAALMEYHRLANVRLANIKAHVDHADKLISEAQKAQKGSAKGNTGMTANAQDKAARADESQEPEAKLAQNKEKQLEALDKSSAQQLGLSGPGIVTALKSGSGVANYTPGVAPSSTVLGKTLYSKPATVTLMVPKGKEELADKDALAAEKERLGVRKQIDKDIQGMFMSPAGKPLTAENVFGSGGLKFGPDGKVVENKTGMVFLGSPEAYYKALKDFNESTPGPKEDKEKFKSVTIPADTYEGLLGKVREISPETTPQSAVQKEIEAHSILNEPAPDARINAPTGLQLPNRLTVPALGANEARGTLRAATAGKPISELTSTPTPDAYAQKLAEADAMNQRVWDASQAAMPERRDPEALFNRTRDVGIAANPRLGYTVRPPQVNAIVNQDERLAQASAQLQRAGLPPPTLEEIQKKFPEAYAKLAGASRANTPGEDLGEYAAQVGLGQLATDLAKPDVNGKLLQYAGKTYGPSLLEHMYSLPSDTDAELPDVSGG